MGNQHIRRGASDYWCRSCGDMPGQEENVAGDDLMRSAGCLGVGVEPGNLVRSEMKKKS